ncbi:MAG TPA: FAD-dependent oxidoreductase [Stellaceae bacterium]|nr:FAD-dependent oxidoreductase [Stellaceae bacterium]
MSPRTVPRFVIIGAGPAGMRAAEVLRSQSAEAEIVLIGDEPYPPYDRPPLSKAFITNGVAPASLSLKPESFYTEQRIELKLGRAALAIDRGAKRVALAGGEHVAYDKLLLATGCGSRRLPPSLAPPSVHYLRSLEDAARIRAALAQGTSLVLIGGGFIGLELAASATTLGVEVTVLEAMPRLLTRGLPAPVCDFMHRLHERHGVRFELDARLKSIAGEEGDFVVSTERATYRCGIVVAGIGAVPHTRLAEAAGLAVEDGIRVDASGRTGDADIFAAGDATRHDNPLLGRAIRVESWQVALNQAAVVARAMLGGNDVYAEMPWLWTDQYDCNIQVLGCFDPSLELLLRGDVRSGAFTLLGLGADGRITLAVTVNNGRDMAVLRRLVTSKASPPKDALADPTRKLADLLKAARAS